MTTLTITPEYAIVLGVLALLAFSLYIHGVVFVMPARKAVFSKAFFDKNFPELKAAPRGGYPDMGNGYYAKKLSHEDWLRLNYAQRAHYNFLEAAPVVFTLIAIAGLAAPRVAAIAGLLFLTGRWLYSFGYVSNGPKGRSVGGGLSSIGLLLSLITAIYSVWTLAGGVEGVTKVIFGN